MDAQLDPPDGLLAKAAGGFLWIEHIIYLALGVMLSLAALIALGGAAAMLWSGLGEWNSTHVILLVIDRLLFVLMLIEILHTVRASMRSGELTCEPFLVVGLIATIRRVLVITLKSSETAKNDTWTEGAQRIFQSSMVELGVLAALIIVMVVSIRLLRSSQQGGS